MEWVPIDKDWPDKGELPNNAVFEDNLYRMSEVINCLVKAGMDKNAVIKALKTAKPYLTYDDDLEEYLFAE